MVVCAARHGLTCINLASTPLRRLVTRAGLRKKTPVLVFSLARFQRLYW